MDLAEAQRQGDTIIANGLGVDMYSIIQGSENPTETVLKVDEFYLIATLKDVVGDAYIDIPRYRTWKEFESELAEINKEVAHKTFVGRVIG